MLMTVVIFLVGFFAYRSYKEPVPVNTHTGCIVTNTHENTYPVFVGNNTWASNTDYIVDTSCGTFLTHNSDYAGMRSGETYTIKEVSGWMEHVTRTA